MCGKSRQPSPSRRPAGIDKRGMAWNHVLLIHTDAKEPDVKAIVLSVFLGGLAVCVLTGASVLWALLLGLACFAGYALRQGHAPRDVALMLWSGVRSVRNILIIFGLIGMLTAVWRASGTLPFIIHHTLQWVDPAYFILWVFLLCCLLSLLLGTAFGSVSLCCPATRATALICSSNSFFFNITFPTPKALPISRNSARLLPSSALKSCINCLIIKSKMVKNPVG